MRSSLREQEPRQPDAPALAPDAGRRLTTYIMPCPDAASGLKEFQPAWPELLLRRTQQEGRIPLHPAPARRHPICSGRSSASAKQAEHGRRSCELAAVAGWAAYVRLMDNSSTYRAYIVLHTNTRRMIQTCELLLGSLGIEVAARPWLYLRPSSADSDIMELLSSERRLKPQSLPSSKTSFAWKIHSRCASCEQDLPLWCLFCVTKLWHSRFLRSSPSRTRKVAPEELLSGRQNFQGLRSRTGEARRRLQAAPNWYRAAAVEERERRPHRLPGQAIMTCHLHHGTRTVLHLLTKGVTENASPARVVGIGEVLEWSCRWEFQGRGTLHVVWSLG